MSKGKKMECEKWKGILHVFVAWGTAKVVSKCKRMKELEVLT
jgi:hypothetical protein